MNQLMWRRFLAHPMSEFLGTTVIIIVLWYGGQLILNQKSSLDAAAFIGYLVFFYNIINPAKAFSTALYSVEKGLASMEHKMLIRLPSAWSSHRHMVLCSVRHPT